MGCKRKDYLGNIITDPCDDADACLNYEPLPSDRRISLTYREYPQDIICLLYTSPSPRDR